MSIHQDYGGADPSDTLADRFAARRELSLIIERALAALDALDDDPDLELTGDESDDSWPEDCNARRQAQSFAEDWEPTLGWREQRAGRGECPTRFDDGEDGGDYERCALESHGMGFFATGHDDAEEDDPGGGDILDEPHDEGALDGIIADRDAAALLHDELWFERVMDNSRSERLRVHDETRQQVARVTGREPPSHWGAVFRIGGRP